MNKQTLQNGLEGLRNLFFEPAADGSLVPSPGRESLFAGQLARAIEHAMRDESIHDYLNYLGRSCDSASLALGRALFDALVRFRSVGELSGGGATFDFLMRNAVAMLTALSAAAPETGADDLRLSPAGERVRGEFALLAAEPGRLPELVRKSDLFSGRRFFRYELGSYLPAEVEGETDLGKFFSFHGVRNAFDEHFRNFAAGRGNVPLLLFSLPGHGKTRLTLSHALAHENLTLILPDEDCLGKNLFFMLRELSLRPDRKFVVFFDDIDTRNRNWHSFCNYVGGAFIPAENVLLVLSSNYEFPPSILSRGRSVIFPVFDEFRCLEMIEEFLMSRGMRKPPVNLVTLIAADYTEEFGQKHFTELSPRTLMRYLNVYERDPARRRQMVERACGNFITRPDASLFYEFNVRLMRELYGEAYIERMLKEKLRKL